jgi:hypothetical protein
MCPSEQAAERPYFVWDYDLTDEHARAILAGDNEFEKIQMMTRIMESARWDDIWRYLTLSQICAHWDKIRPRMRREIRDLWAWALEVWGCAAT